MFAIIETPNYYQGTCSAPQTKYLRNVDINEEDYRNPPEGYDVALFETTEEAQEIIDTLEDGPYYTSHGEAGRPGYEIVEYDEPQGDDCYPGTGEGCGSWEEINTDDLPDGVQERLDGLNVEWSRSESDYDIYDAVIDGDEDEPDQCDDDGFCYRYRIVFCPKSLAIQRADGDLGNIHWENPGYYRSK